MRQALEMALEALERSVATCFDQYSHQQVMGRPEHFVNKAITALRLAIDVQNMASESTYKEALAQKQDPVVERAWFTIAELNAWADKKLAENPNWVMPTEEPERKEALAQEQDNAYIYASNLAKTIWQKHYMKESPKFALLDTTEGVLTQIDNMTCGLVREKPAQPEQEPVALQYPQKDIDWQQEQQIKAQASIPPQRTWVGLTMQDVKVIEDNAPSIQMAIFMTEATLKDKNHGNS